MPIAILSFWVCKVFHPHCIVLIKVFIMHIHCYGWNKFLYTERLIIEIISWKFTIHKCLLKFMLVNYVYTETILLSTIYLLVCLFYFYFSFSFSFVVNNWILSDKILGSFFVIFYIRYVGMLLYTLYILIKGKNKNRSPQEAGWPTQGSSSVKLDSLWPKSVWIVNRIFCFIQFFGW